MGTSGSFEIVRTPASYFFSPSGHGKWAKTVFFRIFANYSNAKIFNCHMKADVLADPKMW